MPSLARRARLGVAVAGVLLTMGVARADDLLSLYRQALESNAGYRAAQAEVEAQREVLPQARAQLLPSLSLSGSKGKNRTE